MTQNNGLETAIHRLGLALDSLEKVAHNNASQSDVDIKKLKTELARALNTNDILKSKLNTATIQIDTVIEHVEGVLNNTEGE